LAGPAGRALTSVVLPLSWFVVWFSLSCPANVQPIGEQVKHKERYEQKQTLNMDSSTIPQRLRRRERDTGTGHPFPFPSLDSPFPLPSRLADGSAWVTSAGTPHRLMPGKSPGSRLPATSSLRPAPSTHADQLRKPSQPKGQRRRLPPTFSFGNLSPSRCAATQMARRGLRGTCYTPAPTACHADQLRLTPQEYKQKRTIGTISSFLRLSLILRRTSKVSDAAKPRSLHRMVRRF
jgi:hypothetical protein